MSSPTPLIERWPLLEYVVTFPGDIVQGLFVGMRRFLRVSEQVSLSNQEATRPTWRDISSSPPPISGHTSMFNDRATVGSI